MDRTEATFVIDQNYLKLGPDDEPEGLTWTLGLWYGDVARAWRDLDSEDEAMESIRQVADADLWNARIMIREGSGGHAHETTLAKYTNWYTSWEFHIVRDEEFTELWRWELMFGDQTVSRSPGTFTSVEAGLTAAHDVQQAIARAKLVPVAP